MSGKMLKEKLSNGETVYGTFFRDITNPAIVDVLPDEGLDFIIVTCEHNALDLADFQSLRYALNGKGIACLVRVHSHNLDDLAKTCDSFPDGVVIPYVEDVEELKQLVAATKYRPLKGEALERAIVADEWPSEKTRTYIEENCANTFFCPMIESVKAVENLDVICAIQGIDAILVGPNDLTVSMGIPEERDNKLFVDMIQHIIDVAKKYGVAAGVHFSNISHALRTIEQGGRFMPFGSDLSLIQLGILEFLEKLQGKSNTGKEKII